MRSSRQRGLTLIELLVVIAVLILLAAVLLPVLALARDQARQVTCISRLHQLGLAHRLYTQDYDDTLPSWYLAGPLGQMQLWTDFLRPYYRHPALLQEVLTHPSARPTPGWVADTALCAWGPAGDGSAALPYWRWPGAPTLPSEGSRPMRAAEVVRPSEVLQFADGFTVRSGASMSSEIVPRRHLSGRLNGAFVDGHAGSIQDRQWARVGRDTRGYFRALSAADR
jgi:prepilin-type processing-associated H-X9-DG protein